MSSGSWTPAAVASAAQPWRGSVWRIVEAQHIASTMKIVDTLDEQDLLEQLLESSKPARTDDDSSHGGRRLHHLLATPFRYHPLRQGSRFRAVTDPGVYYGAGVLRTAAAELGYWRWRFLIDAVGLERIDPVAHTAFKADIAGQAVDLRRAPFDADAPLWAAPIDYGPTQQFARLAREAQTVDAIIYRSVRDVEPGMCLALLSPRGFAKPVPQPQMQTWFLAVTREQVTWRREREAMAFAWGEPP